MKTIKMFRQGDVCLRQISKIPATAKRQASEKHIVLAYGEVTGHKHLIDDGESCEVFETEDQRIINVIGREIAAIRCRNTRNGGICWIPAGADASRYQNLEAVVEETVMGVVLSHEEHFPFVITAGAYVAGGSGKMHTQREYWPEAIRNVAD